jgi:hypothetical protein
MLPLAVRIRAAQMPEQITRERGGLPACRQPFAGML